MKSIIIYSSQTGFTEKYAHWLAEILEAEVITFAEAKKKSPEYFEDADEIIYGGWAMAGKIVNSDWFIKKIPIWKEKKLVLFCVGASSIDNPDVDVALQKMLSDEEKKYAKVFYCQGGLSYEKMKLPSKLAMKAFATMIRNSKNPTEQEKVMGQMISESYDISDKKYVNPIVEYLRG